MAESLERGLGEMDPQLLAAFHPRDRLAVGVCGIVSVAISHYLSEHDVHNRMVLSNPQLDIDPDLRHAAVVLEEGGADTIIDATYTQFYGYAGLSPALKAELPQFPRKKIVQFPLGEHQQLVQNMSEQASGLITHLGGQRSPQHRAPEFTGMNRHQIASILDSIWSPENLTSFQPSFETMEAGKHLARFILPKRPTLVD